METEIWKPIAGWEGLYEVSSLGRVRALPTKYRHGIRVLKPSLRVGGYYRVTLTSHQVSAQILIHRLVLVAFIGPCPPGCESRHLDGVRSHNWLSNLRWGTKLENAADRKIHGTQCLGEGHGRAKITEADVVNIRLAAGKIRQTDLAKKYGIVQSKISAIQRRELWRHVP